METQLKQKVYLLLSIVGAVWPYTKFIPFLQTNGLDIPLIIEQLFATNISAFFGIDLIVSALVCFYFFHWEGRRLEMKKLWIYYLGLLTIGVSFALPLFLFYREKALKKT